MGWCTAQWKMLLFCAKTIVKESRKFELARLKKKKEKHFGRLVTFWLGTFAMLISCYNTLPFIFVCFHDEKTPSVAKKHRESTEPESHQTAKMFIFLLLLLLLLLLQTG